MALASLVTRRSILSCPSRRTFRAVSILATVLHAAVIANPVAASGAAASMATSAPAAAGAAVAIDPTGAVGASVVSNFASGAGEGAGAGGAAAAASTGASAAASGGDTDVTYSAIVVGAGLAGATAARQLLKLHPKATVLVLEASDHVGGRLRNGVTGPVDPDDAAAGAGGAFTPATVFDLGAAWTWPSHDRHLAIAAQLAGKELVPQPERGAAVVQVSQHAWQQMDTAVFTQERRVVGGAASLPTALLAACPADKVTVRTSCAVTKVTLAGDKKTVRVEARCGSGAKREDVTFTAQHVIVAATPLVVHERVAFEPPLPAAVVDAMRRTPVWMADMAKIGFAFDRPFWQTRGQSGSGFARAAPMGQVWDNGQKVVSGGVAARRPASGSGAGEATTSATASGDDGPAPAKAALVGFVFGEDAAALAKGGASAALVRRRALSQLADMFGSDAPAKCTGVAVAAWPAEEWISPSQAALAAAKRAGPPRTAGHNGFGASELRTVVCMAGRVHLAGTETEDEAGHMEGAARSGLRVAQAVADALA